MGRNYYEKRNLYSDARLVDCYLKYHSQNKAAAELKVSRETVARAVRRSGIKMDGRKYNCFDSNKRRSALSDAQLEEDSKTMNCAEIAKKYGLSQEQVFRRARKLGIKPKTNWIGGHWRRRSRFYGCKEFDESITLTLLCARDAGICQICGKPVDDSDIEEGHIRRNYPTLDHIVPLSKGGTHTWENVQLAHMGCNAGKRDRRTEGN